MTIRRASVYIAIINYILQTKVNENHSNGMEGSPYCVIQQQQLLEDNGDDDGDGDDIEFFISNQNTSTHN